MPIDPWNPNLPHSFASTSRLVQTPGWYTEFWHEWVPFGWKAERIPVKPHVGGCCKAAIEAWMKENE